MLPLSRSHPSNIQWEKIVTRRQFPFQETTLFSLIRKIAKSILIESMKPPLSKNSTKGSTSHMKFSQKNSLSSSSTFKNSTGSLARFGNLQRQSWNKQRDPSLTQNTHQNVDFLKSKSSTPLRSNYYSKMDMFRQKNKIGSDSPLIEIFKKPNYFTDKYDMIRSPQPHY